MPRAPEHLFRDSFFGRARIVIVPQGFKEPTTGWQAHKLQGETEIDPVIWNRIQSQNPSSSRKINLPLITSRSRGPTGFTPPSPFP